MKRIIIESYGGADVLRVVEEQTPEPGKGMARIRLVASGINFIDIYHRSGLYPLPELPHGLGTEGVGIIEKLHALSEQWHVGDTVVYTGAAPGSYATHQLVPEDRLISVPEGIPPQTLAACFLKGMTVEYLVERCYPVKAGQTVLFHAMAGGVGQLACQWLKRLGCTVIGTCGGAEKCDIARKLGADHVIDYQKEDVVARVKDITSGKGVPVVYDSIGAAMFESSLKCLQMRGTLVSFGNASGPVTGVDLGILAKHGGLYVTRPVLAHYTSTRTEYEHAANRLFAMLKDGLAVSIPRRVTLDKVAETHDAMENRLTRGSSIVVME